ncbi:DUF1868 domain-containing protein [Fluviispira sanaruensis]|uniref:DUF1868 domain-containing protein n=1 Tax=Fluviispira sanaruensis TaxID=2493639 RepID=A0A4P2VI40_FLUSA|nr:DUF1868 domain-containing protein [Fluviispira sanaruensis]BBH52048.1 DUF1868 domain-containing protein [Fluviispira sanaruensis]
MSMYSRILFAFTILLRLIFIFLILISLFFAQLSYAELKKIDSSGKYSQFPGITVISKVNKDNHKMWDEIEQKLSQDQLITKYFSLLPAKSYHMTTINLFTKRNHGGQNGKDWNSFIKLKKPLLKNLKIYLEKNAFEPHLKRVELLKTRVTSVISLKVPLEYAQMEKIQMTAAHFSLESKIPKPFHITLAYAYKKIPKKIYLKIIENINKILNPILYTYRDKSVTFEVPKINYFLDMTAYNEWNESIDKIEPQN